MQWGFWWSLNWPAWAFTMFTMPLLYAHGGRVRWPAMYCAMLLHFLFGLSAAADCEMGDRQLSAKLGIAAGVGLTVLPRCRFYPVYAYIPPTLTAAAGIFYTGLHSYRLYDYRVLSAEI